MELKRKSRVQARRLGRVSGFGQIDMDLPKKWDEGGKLSVDK